jgi:hypothetical protein
MEPANVLTALRDTEYLGSHPRASRRVFDVDVEFTDNGVTLRRRRREFGVLRWDNITGLTAAPWDSVEARPTFTRFLFIGIWAFVFRKTTIYAYLTISDSEGDWAFAVPGLTASELRVGLESLQAYLPRPVAATSSGGGALVDVDTPDPS